MHKIDSDGSDAGQFVNGDPQTGVGGTVVSAEWLNDVQENIVAVIEAAGIPLTKDRREDLLDSIHQRIEAMTGSPFGGVAALRANANPQKLVAMVAGTDSVFWFRDVDDSSSVDDGVDVIVDSLGYRWKPRPRANLSLLNDGSNTVESGAAAGQAVADAADELGQTPADFVDFVASGGESYPLASLNVGKWYDSPYSPTGLASMLRVRINRALKKVEVQLSGHGGYSGTTTVDVELEVNNNTLVSYLNVDAEVSLTDNLAPIDFSTANLWGSNGLRWSESVTGATQDRFEVTTDVVPGASTSFRLRLRSVSRSDSSPFHLALGDLLVAVNPQAPLTLVFTPVDGSDYDVLVMQNAPADAGATNRKTFVQATAPVNPADDVHEGDLWYDSTIDDGEPMNKPYRWSGSAWEAVQDSGAAVGAQLKSDLTDLGSTIAQLAQGSEVVPLGALNVTRWYDSPYSPTVQAAMLRLRIDRANKTLEVLHGGYNGHTGTSSVDVEVEVFNNTFVSYTNLTAEVSLTDNLAPIDFSTANLWGSNGLRWSESLSGVTEDRFEMELDQVPGASTVFKVRVRTFSSASPEHLALGDVLVLVDRATPFTFYFSPMDGTDYDVLVMQNAEPIYQGASTTYKNAFESYEMTSWINGSQSVVAQEVGTSYTGTASGAFTSTTASGPTAYGVPDSAAAPIPQITSTTADGVTVKVTVVAMADPSSPSAEAAVAYSPNVGTETSGWMNFSPSDKWEKFVFYYDVPASSISFAQNGSFDDDVSGWSAANGATVSWSSGSLRVQGDSVTAYPRAEQAVTSKLIVGRTYRLVASVALASGHAQLGLGSASTAAITAPGVYAVDLVASSSSTTIELRGVQSTADVAFDDVTLTEVKASADNHYVAVWGDTSGSGDSVLIDSVTVEPMTPAAAVDASALLNKTQIISTVAVTVNETTDAPPATIFDGTDDGDWVDIAEATHVATGDDLVVINGSAELLIDQIIDAGDVVAVDNKLSSSSGWTLNSGWAHDSTSRTIGHTGTGTSTAVYAVSGLTDWEFYRVDVSYSTSSEDVSFQLDVSGGGADSVDALSTTATLEGGELDEEKSAVVHFQKGTGDPSLTFTPGTGGGVFRVNSVLITRFAPGLDGETLTRQLAGPGGPSLYWRMVRGVTTIYESQPFLMSGAGQVPALFFDRVDVANPGGSQTYKIQVKWEKGSYDAGQVDEYELNSGGRSIVKGTGTYWGTYLSPGHVITWSDYSAEVVSVIDNETIIVQPTFRPQYHVFTTGTSATIDVPNGARWLRAWVVGGGGGGGLHTGATSAGGGGGGGAAYYDGPLDPADAGVTITYTVGAAGSGRTSTTGSGTAGGNSSCSFTVTAGAASMTANGGSGGTSTAGGAGGTASGGTSNYTGGTGGLYSASAPGGDPGGKTDVGTKGEGSTTAGAFGGGGGPGYNTTDGYDGGSGYVALQFLVEADGSTNEDYTSTNDRHSVVMRRAKGFLQVTEYRNAPAA